MTSTRRMIGPEAARFWGPEPHGGEHDWDPDCDEVPACVPTGPRVAEEYEPPPPHYDGGIVQPWDIIDAFGLDYYLGNVLKYILRAGKKEIAGKGDDLNKALNYLKKAIEMEGGRAD